MAEMVSKLGSVIGGLMAAYAMFRKYLPRELSRPIQHYTKKSSISSTLTSKSPSPSTSTPMPSSSATSTPIPPPRRSASEPPWPATPRPWFSPWPQTRARRSPTTSAASSSGGPPARASPAAAQGGGEEVLKVLARNYLDIEEHDLFETIRRLLEEITKMAPTDVAENLIPKLRGEDKERCLRRLVKAIEEAKLRQAEQEKKKRKAAKEEETTTVT